MAKSQKTYKCDELTPEFQIKKAYERKLSDLRIGDANQPSPLDHRKFVIGDEVIIGNLNNAVVAFVSDDFKIIVAEYDNFGKDGRDLVSRFLWGWVGIFCWVVLPSTAYDNKHPFTKTNKLLNIAGKNFTDVIK